MVQEKKRRLPKGPLGLKLTIFMPDFIDEIQEALDKAAAEKKNTSCPSLQAFRQRRKIPSACPLVQVLNKLSFLFLFLIFLYQIKYKSKNRN